MDKTTEQFASYAAGLSYRDLTPGAIHSVKRCVIDSLGCAFGAFNAEPIRAVRNLAAKFSATPPASLIGTAVKSSPDMAAFANGAMIRYRDFNDDYFGGNGVQAGPHPSDSIAGLLAATEWAGADGKALILGTVIAYEAVGHLVDNTALHPNGWDHPTMHAVGTALGGGKVMGLSREQLGNAIALAVVPNICLRQTRMGEMSNWKGMAGPNGVRNGIFAALLAKEGITGPGEAFEGRAGFMKQVNSPFQLGTLGGKGTPFKVEGTFFKYLPACYAIQLPIWTALALRPKVKVEDIISIAAYVEHHALSVGVWATEKWDPRTRETADHSGPYVVAAALIDGQVNEETFTAKRYRDPTILSLVKKVTVQEDKAYSKEYPRTFNCRLEATLKSGEVVKVHETNPKGHPANPLTDREIEAKFLAQAEPSLPAKQAQQLLDRLWELDKVTDLSLIFQLTLVNGQP